MTRARARAVPEVQLGLFGVPPEVEADGVEAALAEHERGSFGEHIAATAFGERIAANPALAEARHMAEAAIGPSRPWPPLEPESAAPAEPAAPPAPAPIVVAPVAAPVADATITPLLKYPGGKAKLAPAILSVLFPDGWDHTRFVEPFAGPASVAHTAIARGFRGTVELYDASPIIPTLHREVAYNWPEVERELHALPQSGVTKAVYVSVRNAFNRTAPGPVAVAQYLWLNRMCYNGLHRFSRVGFNADYGKKRDVPLDVVLEAGRAAWGRYADVKLRTRQTDFAAAFTAADPTLAVFYCDPPYLSGYDNYTPAGFKVADHHRLAETARYAARQGHRVAISGVDTPAARDVYVDAEVRIIGTAARSINRDGAGRAPAIEVLFLYGSF